MAGAVCTQAAGKRPCFSGTFYRLLGRRCSSFCAAPEAENPLPAQQPGRLYYSRV